MNNKQIIKSLIQQELRLIYRTPRAKKLCIGGILMQFAQLFLLMSVIERNSLHKSQLTLFMLTCYGALPLFSYMQFGMAWQGNNLCMYFSRQVTLKQLLWSKYLLSVLAAFAAMIISFIFLCYLGEWNLAGGAFGAFMFVAGFNATLICVAYKKLNKKIDRQAGGLMANWRGLGSAQHILGIVYMAPVVGILGLAAYFKLDIWYCVLALLLLGAAMLTVAFRHVAYADNENNKYFLIKTFGS